ncbi:MAG TPA: carbon-nitrogen hydrolase family protein [Aeromicrobium sp.]|nr:carbon-nitrogen hydrolase family protein [Aeromicrobium sp.]
MRIAVVQVSSGIDSAANREHVAGALSGLEAGFDLVVLPEAVMHDFGPTDHDLAAAAEPLDGPFVGLLSDQARRLGATVVAGMFERTDALPFNTLVAVGPGGELLATYRKIHLYDSFGYRESDRLSPGPLEPVVLDVADLKVGLMTCYDLRFPELGRALVDAGALAFAVPAAWVAGPGKLQHWRTLVTARAIENTVAVVAAAQSGEHYTGHSMVVDAAGSMVEEAGEGDAVLRADLGASAIHKTRDVNPSLSNRRMPAP